MGNIEGQALVVVSQGKRIWLRLKGLHLSVGLRICPVTSPVYGVMGTEHSMELECERFGIAEDNGAVNIYPEVRPQPACVASNSTNQEPKFAV